MKRVVLTLVVVFTLGVQAVSSALAARPGTWRLTDDMTTGRVFHTATVLLDGRVLVTAGRDCPDCAGALASAELYQPKGAGTWTSTETMSESRSGHTATLLQDGRVLVAGGIGICCDTFRSSAELWDPSTGTWATTGPMIDPRYQAAAVRLENGKVLVVGGLNNSGFLSSAELYDPATGTWQATASMSGPRAFLPTATLLNDGRVLVVGGSAGFGGLDSAEIYTPATETSAASWSPTPPLNEGRLEHTATLLRDGRVLVAGGSKIGPNSNATYTAEIYSLSSNTWALGGSLATARHSHVAVLLSSGQVLVAGGIDTTSLASVELYDQASDAWTPTGGMTVGRQHATVSLIRRGGVLVAGGLSFGEHLRSAEIYSPSRGRSSHRLRSPNSA